jgi:hypothetical protein
MAPETREKTQKKRLAKHIKTVSLKRTAASKIFKEI